VQQLTLALLVLQPLETSSLEEVLHHQQLVQQYYV
jgi:hypothetical protein